MKLLDKIRINVNNKYVKYRLPTYTEIYLIKWYPKTESDFHDHNGKNCEFYILGFDLKEIRKKNKIKTEQIIDPLKKYTINDTIGVHKIINPHNRYIWSYHKYF